MESFSEIYMQVGAVGFALIILGVSTWRLGEIAKMLAMRKLNGKLTPPLPTPRAGQCPWDPLQSEQWNQAVTDIQVMAKQHQEQQRQIDKGFFSCVWKPESVEGLKSAMAELTAEVRLLRREFELTRKNGH
jgi:hypothetical protein